MYRIPLLNEDDTTKLTSSDLGHVRQVSSGIISCIEDVERGGVVWLLGRLAGFAYHSSS
jgi:hypothetical protein